VSEDETIIVDAGARELVLDGKRVGLTKLEFELVQYLSSRAGKAVSRADLLADVWGNDYGGGSNVVDAVVRGVRRKMGSHAEMLESVRGTGYRMRVA
jgi:DNA-binding response OmpR family regulator